MTYPRMGSLLALLMLVLWPAGARAGCSLNGNTEDVVVTLPSTITLDPNAAVGTVLATSTVATPSPSNSSISCNNTTSMGVMNLVGSQPAGASTIYATGVNGVGYRILHPDSSYYLPPWGYDSISSGTYTLSVGSAVQLVKTDVIASGSMLPAATLAYWRYNAKGGAPDVRAENFVLGNSVTFVSPSCSVTTPNISVTLPTVSNTALASAGATAGSTAFAIQLDCGNASGRTLAIQFDTANAFAGASGVIVPASGTATNVGVQLVDASFAPVTFGTAAVVGTTPNGQFNLTYYARYYATSAPVKAGTLSATATFTLSYP